MRRAVAGATAAVGPRASACWWRWPAPSAAVSVGQALAAPHVYAGGGVLGFGAPQVAPPLVAPLNSVVVAMAPNPVAPANDEGYWLASADGGVYAQGNAGFYGSLGALHLQGPVVAMAATPDGGGYWLVALDGGVFAFGDAGFYGSMGGYAAQPADRRHGLDAGRQGLLAGGLGRRACSPSATPRSSARWAAPRSSRR